MRTSYALFCGQDLANGTKAQGGAVFLPQRVPWGAENRTEIARES